MIGAGGKASRGVVAALLGALLLGGVIFLIISQIGNLLEERALVLSEMAAAVRAEEHLKELKALEEKEAVFQKRMAVLEQAIPAEPGENELLAHVQILALDAGLRLLQARFGERSQKEGFVEMPLQLTFEGRYHGLITLLDSLNQGSRALRVDNINIGSGGEGLPQIRIEITACAFYRPVD